MRNLDTVFHAVCIKLHSHRSTRDPISPHPLQHLLSFVFVRFYNNHPNTFEVMSHYLICIFLMINDIKHLFIYLVVICMSSSERCLPKSLSIFNWVTWDFWSCVSSSYILNINPSSDMCFVNINIFPFHRSPFHFVDCFLCYAEGLWFDINSFLYFSPVLPTSHQMPFLIHVWVTFAKSRLEAEGERYFMSFYVYDIPICLHHVSFLYLFLLSSPSFSSPFP